MSDGTEDKAAEMAQDKAYQDAKKAITDPDNEADVRAAYDAALTSGDFDASQLTSLLAERDKKLKELADAADRQATEQADRQATEQKAYEMAKKAITDPDNEADVTAAYDAAVASGDFDRSQLQSLLTERNKRLGELRVAAMEAREAEKTRQASNAKSMAVADAITKHMITGDANDTAGSGDGHQTELPDSIRASSGVEATGSPTVSITPDPGSVNGTVEIALRRSDNGRRLTGDPVTAPLESWTAEKFSWSNDDGAYEGVVVTSRRGAKPGDPVIESWSSFFASSEEPLDGVTAVADDADGSTAGRVTFSAPDSPAANLEDISIRHFDGTTGLLPSRPETGSNTRTLVEAGTEISGMFLGVPGKYTCRAGSCSVVWNANTDSLSDDTLTFSGGTLDFEPTIPGGSDITLSDIEVNYTKDTIPDTDYLTFGYWVTTTTKNTETSHVIKTFVDAIGYGEIANRGLLATASQGTLRGKATYSGGAAGIYVLKTGDLTDPDAHDGEFVADVALTAQFGVNDGSVAAKNQWTINGEVSDFQSTTTTDGSHDLSPWTLKLNSVDLGTRTAGGIDADAVSLGTNASPGLPFGKTRGFVDGAEGNTDGEWSATFFGNVGSETTDAADAAARIGSTVGTPTATMDDHPKAVIGEFNGHFSNGHVVGAYGAENDDD